MSEQTVRVIPITLPENSSRIVMGEVICSWIIPPSSPVVQHTRFPVAIIATTASSSSTGCGTRCSIVVPFSSEI